MECIYASQLFTTPSQLPLHPTDNADPTQPSPKCVLFYNLYFTTYKSNTVQ